MVLAFQLIMLLMVILSFMGVIAERGKREQQNRLAGFGIAGIIAIVVTFFFL